MTTSARVLHAATECQVAIERITTAPLLDQKTKRECATSVPQGEHSRQCKITLLDYVASLPDPSEATTWSVIQLCHEITKLVNVYIECQHMLATPTIRTCNRVVVTVQRSVKTPRPFVHADDIFPATGSHMRLQGPVQFKHFVYVVLFNMIYSCLVVDIAMIVDSVINHGGVLPVESQAHGILTFVWLGTAIVQHLRNPLHIRHDARGALRNAVKYSKYHKLASGIQPFIRRSLAIFLLQYFQKYGPSLTSQASGGENDDGLFDVVLNPLLELVSSSQEEEPLHGSVQPFIVGASVVVGLFMFYQRGVVRHNEFEIVIAETNANKTVHEVQLSCTSALAGHLHQFGKGTIRHARNLVVDTLQRLFAIQGATQRTLSVGFQTLGHPNVLYSGKVLALCGLATVALSSDEALDKCAGMLNVVKHASLVVVGDMGSVATSISASVVPFLGLSRNISVITPRMYSGTALTRYVATEELVYYLDAGDDYELKLADPRSFATLQQLEHLTLERGFPVFQLNDAM